MNVRRFLPLLLALPLAAQTQTICGPDPSADKDPSLGDFARQHRRASIEKARLSLTEDDLTPSLPMPAIATESTLTNDREIVDAYLAFLQSHTRADGEKLLKRWYDNELSRYSQLNREVLKLNKLLQEDQANDPPGDEEGSNDNSRPELAALSAERNRNLIEKDQLAMTRIQGGLTRLHSALDPKGTRFAWFDPNLNEQTTQQVSE